MQTYETSDAKWTIQQLSYRKIDHAEKTDIGKIALYSVGGNTLAIERTLDDCIRVANENGCGDEPITVDDVDGHTDLTRKMAGDLVAVEITK